MLPGWRTQREELKIRVSACAKLLSHTQQRECLGQFRDLEGSIFSVLFPNPFPRPLLESLKSLWLKRRRSESNRRIEVLQTSALPLGYGAGGSVRWQPAWRFSTPPLASAHRGNGVVAFLVAVARTTSKRSDPQSRVLIGHCHR